MKQALILHGTGGSSQSNWFPWLKTELEKQGYKVWCPDLPNADFPDSQVYNKFLLSNPDFQITNDTILIGHSSGAVAILGLLQALPDDVTVKESFLVGAFSHVLPEEDDWKMLQGLFTTPFDFDKIKQRSKGSHFIHSDDDPYCPLEQAEYLCDKVEGELIVLPGQKHFSTGTAGERYREFPYLLRLISKDAMDEQSVVDFIEACEKEDIKIWFLGGWGVDALLRKQTRAHSDVDIVILKKDVETLRKVLEDKGFNDVKRGDTSAWNFVLGNDQCQMVDFHVIELDEDGNGLYGQKENKYVFTKEALSGKGIIASKKVSCISPEWIVKQHMGYEPRESDVHDVLAICEKFKINIPDDFRR